MTSFQGQTGLSVLLLQLGGNFIEEALHLHRIALRVLRNIRAIKGQNTPLDMIDTVEVFGFHILRDCLGHVADDHILAEISIALRCSACPSGFRFSKQVQMRSISVSLPSVQRNFSKSIGYILRWRSSEVMVMSLTFFLMDMSKPVST